ncbi:glycosyltransferase family 1 protein [Opitutaceae bacterium TAV4]|nr:glycosyltransferase family 1 protein [Opitutaceae bacterium TAV4]
MPSPMEPIERHSPYFLCVGSLQPHKNLSSVVTAWRKFRIIRPDYRLKVVGKPQARFSGLNMDLSSLSNEGVDFTGYIDDNALVDLYRNAVAFLYPSLEEGFGLPVVEAFNCGCPVVTSAISCLPEISGGAAHLIDPYSAEQLTEAMIKISSESCVIEMS